MRIGLGIKLRGYGGGGAPAAFDPATLFAGTAGGFYNVADSSTLFQSGTRAAPGAAVTADGDPVGLMLDKSGNNNDVAITTTQRPLYKPNSGLPYLLFDGVNDCLRALFAMSTTWDRISAMQVVAFSGTTNECYFGGGNVPLELFGDGTNALTMWNNSATGPQASPTAGVDFVLTERWANPAPCQMALDNNAYDSTPSIAGINPGGVTFGAMHSNVDPANMRLYSSLMIDRAMTAGEIASVRTYMGARQGRVL
jgi:hypothetical protein